MDTITITQEVYAIRHSDLMDMVEQLLLIWEASSKDNSETAWNMDTLDSSINMEIVSTKNIEMANVKENGIEIFI